MWQVVKQYAKPTDARGRLRQRHTAKTRHATTEKATVKTQQEHAITQAAATKHHVRGRLEDAGEHGFHQASAQEIPEAVPHGMTAQDAPTQEAAEPVEEAGPTLHPAPKAHAQTNHHAKTPPAAAAQHGYGTDAEAHGMRQSQKTA